MHFANLQSARNLAFPHLSIASPELAYSGKKEKKQASAPLNAASETLDPRTFLTQEILMASSSAKMAELVAQEIYNIRESKNALLRGEADNMPNFRFSGEKPLPCIFVR